MKNFEFCVLGACALFVAVVAWRQLVRAWREKSSDWIASILLLVTAFLLTVSAVESHKSSSRAALPPMDTASIRATFLDLGAQGSQRQLVFRYRLRNTSESNFLLDGAACSTVSFRFVPGAKYDPASALLEKDSVAYEQYTGLTRLPSKGIELSPCPLVLKPGEGQDVTLTIPYSYPPSFGSPNESNLRGYVRATMRNVDGFGAANARGTRGILFPKGW